MHKPDHPLPQATLAQMADALMWPLLVLRADGTLLHANRAARRLLSSQRLLTLRPDRRLGLLPASRQADLDAARAAAAQGQTALLGWPAGDGQPAISASLSRLGRQGGSDSDSGNGVAPRGGELLLALSASEQPDGQVLSYARLHRLSPAETRVLQRLALGDNSGAAAQALGVSTATVRSQVISLRRKTGHASVLHLLQGLAAMPPVHPQASPGLLGE
jgi:DNA-binding CsgD family transcriptional regulator